MFNMKDANFIAKCLIRLASNDPENDMTNMKIQKLLYYAQGTHLALHREKLFAQDIIKWQYGPVVPDVYHKLKLFGQNVIQLDEPVDFSQLNDKEVKTIKMVYDFFGQFSAIKLMNLTHDEAPWQSVEMNEIINEKSLIDFFDTIVIKE